MSDRMRRELESDLFRPRDRFDVDVHPESMRGTALALMDAQASIIRTIKASVAALPWWKRYPARLLMAAAWAWARLIVRFEALRRS